MLDNEFAQDCDAQILQHARARLVEIELCGSCDSKMEEYLHEVAIQEELSSFETTQTVAEAFRARHGEDVSIPRLVVSSTQVKFQIKQRAHISVPKAIRFDGKVASQIPTK